MPKVEIVATLARASASTRRGTPGDSGRPPVPTGTTPFELKLRGTWSRATRGRPFAIAIVDGATLQGTNLEHAYRSATLIRAWPGASDYLLDDFAVMQSLSDIATWPFVGADETSSRELFGGLALCGADGRIVLGAPAEGGPAKRDLDRFDVVVSSIVVTEEGKESPLYSWRSVKSRNF